jgi:hypothetical protein
MPNVKQSPCCARRAAKLVMDEANLRRLAQRAAKRSEKGLSIVDLTAQIDECKAIIALDKQAITDHEADHAGGGL